MKQKTIKDNCRRSPVDNELSSRHIATKNFDPAYSLDEYKKKAKKESKKFRDLRKQKRSQDWF